MLLIAIILSASSIHDASPYSMWVVHMQKIQTSLSAVAVADHVSSDKSAWNVRMCVLMLPVIEWYFTGTKRAYSADYYFPFVDRNAKNDSHLFTLDKLSKPVDSNLESQNCIVHSIHAKAPKHFVAT